MTKSKKIYAEYLRRMEGVKELDTVMSNPNGPRIPINDIENNNWFHKHRRVIEREHKKVFLKQLKKESQVREKQKLLFYKKLGQLRKNYNM